MLSRAADALYWMSRYAERAENVARFLDVSLQVMLDLPDSNGDPWAQVIAATGELHNFIERYGTPSRDGIVRFLTIDPDSQNSILTSISKARDNARSIREAISSETWEQINKWYLLVREAAANENTVGDPHEFLALVKEASHLFVGVIYLTMTHGEGWHFGRLGRLLERADQTSRIVDTKRELLRPSAPEFGTGLDDIHLSALLRSVSALEMYRKKYGRLHRTAVTEFLLLDKLFPRSIRHCLDKAQQSLQAITGTPPDAYGSRPERLLGRIAAEYEFTIVDEIVEQGLHEHLDRLQSKLNETGAAIYETFFATRSDTFAQQDAQSQLQAPAKVASD